MYLFQITNKLSRNGLGRTIERVKKV